MNLLVSKFWMDLTLTSVVLWLMIFEDFSGGGGGEDPKIPSFWNSTYLVGAICAVYNIKD